jgi:hypothetical protein
MIIQEKPSNIVWESKEVQDKVDVDASPPRDGGGGRDRSNTSDSFEDYNPNAKSTKVSFSDSVSSKAYPSRLPHVLDSEGNAVGAHKFHKSGARNSLGGGGGVRAGSGSRRSGSPSANSWTGTDADRAYRPGHRSGSSNGNNGTGSQYYHSNSSSSSSAAHRSKPSSSFSSSSSLSHQLEALRLQGTEAFLRSVVVSQAAVTGASGGTAGHPRKESAASATTSVGRGHLQQQSKGGTRARLGTSSVTSQDDQSELSTADISNNAINPLSPHTPRSRKLSTLHYFIYTYNLSNNGSPLP